MFPALLAHLQEALHKRHLVYCVRVMSVGCYQDWSGTGVGDISSILSTVYHALRNAVLLAILQQALMQL
jgi:hypothetical protein